MTGPTTSAPRRLTLLYQLYLTNQATRRFMRLALATAPLSGEEFAVLSYLFANGPRTLSQAARDLGTPVTSLATTFAPLVESGRIDRRPHPRDRRARLLSLTAVGQADLQATIPPFSEAYRRLLEELAEAGADVERLFEALAALRTGIEHTSDLLEDGTVRAAAVDATG